MLIGFVLTALAAGFVVEAAYCDWGPSPDAQPNVNPVYTNEPVFVKAVRNGKLYLGGLNDDTINIVHVWGTSYERGYAHGELMKDSAVQLYNELWQYLELQVELMINGSEHFLKPWAVKLISDVGLEVALDLYLVETAPFTGQHFFDEIQGLADATGYSAHRIKQLHLIGELTDAQCSMFGAWGNSVINTNSQLLQMRALDWDVNAPFTNYPQITVYHDSVDSIGNPFLMVAWTGIVGTMTGISAGRIAAGDIGVEYPDATFGNQSHIGIPFVYILRDVVQFDTNMEEIKARITLAHRTCYLIFGFGDGNNNIFNSVEYSHDVAIFMNDSTQMPLATWHPRMDNVVYYGMDWLCPQFDEVLYAQLTKYYGNITLANTKTNITPIVQTGNLHVAIFDLTNMNMWLSIARRTGYGGPQMAYDRAFTQYDLKQLFAVTQ